MPKKLTIEYIRGKFKDRGHILLTTEYINNRQTLECICPNGHKRWISWGDFQRNRGCKMCFSESKKMDIEFIKKEFERKECILLTTEYENNKQRLSYICSNGHRQSITWSKFQQGGYCPICKQLEKKEMFIKKIKKFAKKQEYSCLSSTYKNSYTKLEFKCYRGHKFLMKWNDFQQGERCPICKPLEQSQNTTGFKHWNWKGGISKEPYCQEWTNELKEFIKQRDGYKCMNPCCNSKDPDDLTIHHFRYNKKVCGSEDLITVCRSCNSYANYNREFHEAWYKAIMYRRYQYDY